MRELLAPDDTRDVLRALGGVLLGIGVLMLILRRDEDPGDFLTFVLYAVAAAYLYGAVFSDRYTNGTRPWAAVNSVFGLLFVPLALGEFVDLVGGDSGSSLNVFWIFGVTAALGFYAGSVKGVRFQLLAGSIATIIAWSALWNELLGDEGIGGHFGTYRGLLGILSIILLVGALYLWRQGPDTRVVGTAVEPAGDQGLLKASELLTGAGISAVIACSLGISSVAQFAVPFGLGEITVVRTSSTWDVLLLLVSLGVIGLAAGIGVRGPAYVGAVGLGLFLLIVGLDLNEGADAQPDKIGLWPAVLLVIGGLLTSLSLLREASLGDGPRQFVDSLRGGGAERPR
ncbi:MAG TPA: hypothetical protein VHH72_10675 [Solirubrobacterales bacterium]|nr:hypothetical protein [Solirubrobacterales bacterium]